jgi:hypothetical protein
MAPRKFSVNYLANQADGFQPGDEAAHRAAAALGDRADMPTIAAFSEMLAMLERVGGQFYVTALRVPNEEGEFDTLGLVFNYETRDAKIEFLLPPEEISGVPVTDISAEPTRIEVEVPGNSGDGLTDEEREFSDPTPEPDPEEESLPEPALTD